MYTVFLVHAVDERVRYGNSGCRCCLHRLWLFFYMYQISFGGRSEHNFPFGYFQCAFSFIVCVFSRGNLYSSFINYLLAFLLFIFLSLFLSFRFMPWYARSYTNIATSAPYIRYIYLWIILELIYLLNSADYSCIYYIFLYTTHRFR